MSKIIGPSASTSRTTRPWSRMSNDVSLHWGPEAYQSGIAPRKLGVRKPWNVVRINDSEFSGIPTIVYSTYSLADAEEFRKWAASRWPEHTWVVTRRLNFYCTDVLPSEY